MPFWQLEGPAKEGNPFVLQVESPGEEFNKFSVFVEADLYVAGAAS